jgi:hypothetical protein
LTMRIELFRKATGLLASPAGLLAISVLLINDHLLRRMWPSWWTGKIGDFAWLFFFPFVLLALLAWLLPQRALHYKNLAPGLAFGLTGLIFALGNTLPGFHALVLSMGERLLGIPLRLYLDPTDLLALPALWLGWRFWQTPAYAHSTHLQRRRLAPLAPLVLAAFLTLANAAAPEYGIACLEADRQMIIADSTHQSFVSHDGGLTWERGQNRGGFCQAHPTERIVFEPDEGQLGYRIIPRESIEVTQDGGQNWQMGIILQEPSQAENAYLRRMNPGNLYFMAPPLDVLIDPTSGNTVFAMGHEGILVHTAEGEWVWAVAGQYQRYKLDNPGAFFELLMGEGLLAIAFGLLVAATQGLHISRSWLRIVGLSIGWLLCLAPMILFPPALSDSYFAALTNLLLIACLALTAGLAIEALVRLWLRFPKSFWRALVSGLAAIPLFSLPYVIWGLNGIRNYMWAAIFAIALIAALTVTAYFWTRPKSESEGQEPEYSQS